MMSEPFEIKLTGQRIVAELVFKDNNLLSVYIGYIIKSRRAPESIKIFADNRHIRVEHEINRILETYEIEALKEETLLYAFNEVVASNYRDKIKDKQLTITEAREYLANFITYVDTVTHKKMKKFTDKVKNVLNLLNTMTVGGVTASTGT